MTSLRTAVPIAVPMAAPMASPVVTAKTALPVPDYMRDVYRWAYIDPRNVRLLDRNIVVSTILWGNNRRLQRITFGEFEPGQRVLQAAHVYGDVVPNLARRIGPKGHLEAIDITPIQVACMRRKLTGLPWVRVRRANAREPGGGPYDGVCSYFLLHEVPDDWKRAIVDGLLASVKPGGKAVFLDYHQPPAWHPLKGLMSTIFDHLEPFAKGLWDREIWELAENAAGFSWRKETYFGGLYQKVVARPLAAGSDGESVGQPEFADEGSLCNRTRGGIKFHSRAPAKERPSNKHRPGTTRKFLP
ncbi:MAG: class I SAM-dependent methyltransferase [Rhodospirillales bacterium]|nr:class I SAM-dependent methyltransferase [Rhodospirillales bacterium]